MKRLMTCLVWLSACDAESTPDGTVEGVCGPSGRDDPFADCVEDFVPAAEVSFGHDELPDVVLGPPMPNEAGGSLDVASLGCGGQITLYFDPPHIVDGPGPDFIVFENPFPFGDATFAEPAQVLVSDDGATWHAFDCEPAGDGMTPPLGCAGVHVVHAHPDDDSATDPDRAGGDAFDLAQLGLSEARYVRLIDVTEEHYGTRTWCSGASGGFDLDAVAIAEHDRTGDGP